VKYFFESYGCQMNMAESAALALAAKERGWEEAESSNDADLVLINTCSVRATAEERVFGRLAQYEALKKKRLAGGRPFTLVLAGCMAERLGDGVKEKYPAVDYAMGTRSRPVFPHILEGLEKGCRRDTSYLWETSGEKADFVFSSSHLEDGSFRSFVPIMHGCNNFCSYCIVPYVRGREVSRSPSSIVEEIKLLAEKGVREITLLGQNVNSYRYSAAGFPALLKLAAETVRGTPIKWVRFLSSHPKDLSDEAIAVMAAHRCFCRHLHLPVQHGSDRILEKMNRRYTGKAYLELVRRIREAMPDISLSTDILVGFPGETAEDLEDTLALMEEVKFLYSYMYHFNPREGTAAFDLPGRIPDEEKRRRLARVIELQRRHTAERLKERKGKEALVLVEGISRKNADELICRTERDEMVAVPGSASALGRFGRLKLSGIRGNTFRSKNIEIEEPFPKLG
jgi:tRNA-2-methylthio-N6-dimethylallyladenosine synthase